MLYFAAMLNDIWMMRCLQLAANGGGLVAPNPMVGAVLVQNDRIIGEGYHHEFGGAHAEVIAIRSVHDETLLAEATLYVNLEPCSHHGKTPPCADLIIEKGIKNVVVGQMDPNPLVSGRGIQRLRDAGIDVTVGIAEAECKFLNRRFNTFHTKQRPHVILKWAQSADGFMDRRREAEGGGGIHWISHPMSNIHVHKWRTEEQAILVGYNTVVNDNPRLTPRLVAGAAPLRIILAGNRALPQACHLLTDALPALIFHFNESKKIGAKEWVKVEPASYFDRVMLELRHRAISSVLVEGGRFTLDQFFKSALYDEVRVISAPQMMSEGLPAPYFPKGEYLRTSLGEDQLYTWYRS